MGLMSFFVKSSLLRKIDNDDRRRRSTVTLGRLETMYKNDDEESRVANIQENPMHIAMADALSDLKNENEAQKEEIRAKDEEIQKRDEEIKAKDEEIQQIRKALGTGSPDTMAL